MSEQPRYSIVIEWSEEDQAYIVSLPEWGNLIHTHGDSYDEALHRGKELIEVLIATRQQQGESLPVPRVFTTV